VGLVVLLSHCVGSLSILRGCSSPTIGIKPPGFAEGGTSILYIFDVYQDVTNTLESQNVEKMNEIKASNEQAVEDRPSANLRKRKSTATNDLSMQSTASIEKNAARESEDDEVENKKLKRKALRLSRE